SLLAEENPTPIPNEAEQEFTSCGAGGIGGVTPIPKEAEQEFTSCGAGGIGGVTPIPNEAKKFIDNVISISFVLLGIFVALGVAFAPLVSRLISGGEFTDPEHIAFLTFSLRILMPVMIFFGFGAIFTGLLQSHGSFRLPAFASAPGGIILIVYIIFFSDRFGVAGLVFATALGVLMQPVVLLPAVWRLGYRYKFALDLRNKNVRAAGKLCIPIVISAASYQMHFLFGHSVALQLNTTAVMDYAQQVVQVLILTIVYAIAAVYFPKLSVLWAKKAANPASDAYNEVLRNAMLYVFFLVLPAASGVFILRMEIMDFLLNFGDTAASGPDGIILAGNLMGAYSIGVIAIAFKEVADRAFYSEKDSVTPAIFGVLIMIVNISVVFLLVGRFGAFAMPAAYGIAAIIGGGGLLFILHKRIKFVNLKFLGELFKNILAVAIMMSAAFFVREADFFDNRILGLILPAIVGAVVYFAAAFALRISALQALKK
ncbi:MAG: polysaccharide biosynthesis C-terminal domain-containing protein, partial [Defluviitaleaceae bacterium]|nr:polysaccharide biosynthesis C-terminal domain-containing protein [Defluviitaleaceae bacterium]